jgi:O-antigen/teichoic acid export membrane protein
VKERLALLRNVAMLTMASYAEMAFGLILGVVIARSLGSTDFGHYAFAVWVCGTLITLSNNALTMCSIRFIAEARGAGQLDAAAALKIRLHRWQIISSTSVVTLFALGVLIHPPQEWKTSFVWMIPLMMVGAWSRSGYAMMASIAKGHERFEVESIALVFSAFVNLVLVLLLAFSGGSLIGFVSVYAVCGLVQNLAARVLLRRLQIEPKGNSKPLTLTPELIQRLKRYLMQSGALIGLSLLSDRTLEILLLKNYASSQAVGYFAIAGALTKGATYLLAGALSSVLLPSMSRAFGKAGSGSVARMLHESMRYYWFIGLAIAGLGITVAPGLVRLLYGNQYEGAVHAVAVNLIVSGVVLVSAALNAFHTSSNRQADRIRIALMALAANVLAALAFVPKWGLNGALCSIVVTNVTSVCISWFYARRTLGVTLPATAMLRVLTAAIVAVTIDFSLTNSVKFWGHGWLEGSVGVKFLFIFSGLIFMTTYLFSSVLLKAWTAADYALITEVCNRLGAPGRLAARFALMAQKRFTK